MVIEGSFQMMKHVFGFHHKNLGVVELVVGLHHWSPG